jgi:methylthioribose-1-phosphate isomerase
MALGAEKFGVESVGKQLRHIAKNEIEITFFPGTGNVTWCRQMNILMHNEPASLWLEGESFPDLWITDQRFLPHQIELRRLGSAAEVRAAIREMWVRGAPLIGATAACGLYLAAREAAEQGLGAEWLEAQAAEMAEARPTAVNLAWAVERIRRAWKEARTPEARIAAALAEARALMREDADMCRAIGEQGLPLIEAVARRKPGPVNILTHCNAGRMACMAWGTATAPIYLAHERGIPVHVWVDETRPRNQGASITAWELGQAGIPHTLIADNAGGHLMQHGQVDLCLVGADRVTRQGDAANKIGTYLKALAAHDTGTPFYVALPSSSFDWRLRDGQREIPIEIRSPEEITHISGWEAGSQRAVRVRIAPQSSPALNPGFDVTPARLISGIITERGICKASEAGIFRLFAAEME